MTKNLLLSIVLALSINVLKAQHIFITNNAKISFFSSTPAEDIDATSAKAMSAINLSNGSVYFKVMNTSFQFKSKLMQEHFNENYMESDKYPYSEFHGKIITDKNISEQGTYQVVVEGKLNMHGVIKDYKVPATMTNKNGKISTMGNFKVKLVDHKIEIPTIVFAKIAEVLEIKIVAEYNPK